MRTSVLKITFLLFFLISCGKKEDVIEIYLTKARIETYEGTPLKEELKIKLREQGLSESYIKDVRIDTIKNKLVYAGHFIVKKEDLEEKPFITDTEILGMDFKNSEIHFTKNVAQKIFDSIPSWRKSNHFGKQFVLCHNGKIILSGYLLSAMASYWSNTYQIYYYKPSKENDTIKSVRFIMSDSLNFEKYHLKENKELYNTFKNRIVK